MSDIPERIVRCPQCGKPAVYSAKNPARPFCSERCRLIDLGAWADESFRIPVEKTSEDLEIFEEDEEKSD